MFMGKAFRFFRRIRQHALAFVAQRKIDRGGNFLADGGVTFDLLADRLHRGVRAQEAIGQGLVFPQQSEQQVFGLNVGRTELASLVPRKKDDAPGFLRITFKHRTSPPGFLRSAPPPRQTLTLPVNYAFISLNPPSDIRLLVTEPPYVRVVRWLIFRAPTVRPLTANLLCSAFGHAGSDSGDSSSILP